LNPAGARPSKCIIDNSHNNHNQNNNAFTWSGPSGVVIAPDNGAEGRLTGGCSRLPRTCDGCVAVPLNAAESPVGENLRGGKRLRLRFWKDCLLQHTYPFALNRPPIASLQLYSQIVSDSVGSPLKLLALKPPSYRLPCFSHPSGKEDQRVHLLSGSITGEVRQPS
jgi:hypothetical protein